jgi:outer membrane protein
MYRIVIIILGLLVVLQLPVLAQTVRQNLTLEEAIRLSLENNLTLMQQEDRIRQAEAELKIQKTGYLPSLNLGSSYNYTSELASLELPFSIPGVGAVTIDAGTKNRYDLNATINQPLFTGFRIRNLNKAAEQQMKESYSQNQIARNSILLNTHDVYYAAQLNLLQQNILSSSITRGEQDLQLVKNFLQAGQVSPFDTMKVANHVLNLNTQFQSLQHQQIIILSQLAYILNIQSISSIKPVDLKNIPLSLETFEYYKNAALKSRPELSQIRNQIAAQQYRRNALRSGFLPQVYGQASYHYARPGVNFFKDEWMNYYTIGISLNWELWNWGKTRNQVRQAQYTTSILTTEQEKLIESVKQDMKQAYESLFSDRDQIYMTTKLVDQEKERYRITREKYQQGLATTIDLSDAENSLTVAELQLQQSYINWLKDQVNMRYLTGTIYQTD